VLVLAAIAMFVASCSGGSDSDGSSMSVQDGDIVDVHYVLTSTDGDVIDSSRERGTAFTFTVASGQVIPGFDLAVTGMSVGEVNTVELAPEDGYGQRDESLIVEVPIAPSQSDVAVGDVVFINNTQRAVVLAINGDVATVDANHELAGQVLTFEIELLAITR